MARRRRRTGNVTLAKRSVLWLPFDVQMTLATAGTVVESGDILANYFGQTGAEVEKGTTLGPIRGRWAANPLVATAFETSGQIEAVLQLVPEGGRAVSPVPGVDIIDAMWYGQMFLEGFFGESASGVFKQSVHSQVFETKAMRKVTGNGQVLTIHAVQESNTDYEVKFIGSILLKLP